MILIDIISNPIFQATLGSSIVAQLLKTAFDYWRHKKFNWRSLFRGAGMPSSHTATVVGLVISVFVVEGVSNIFMIVLCLSSIVIRDVIGDKVFATHQENIINNIVQQLLHHEKVQWNHLIGHTIVEVIAGAIVGAVVTTGVFLLA